jgi:outer membrane protein OmpA-like peptidoglycan-associated protein
MAAEHEGSGLASSLTDLMTSLAIIFILLLVATLNNARQEVKGAKDEVLDALEKELKEFSKQGVQVDYDPKDPLGLLVLVPEGLLKFKQNDPEPPPQGVEFLREFMPKLVGTACKAGIRDGISSIVVEGHASSEGTEQRNLVLSQERSMSVVQKGLGVLPSELHPCFLGLVSAAGRGSGETLVTQGIEDRERSRRVIFKIRVKSLEQRYFIAGISPEAAKQENGK